MSVAAGFFGTVTRRNWSGPIVTRSARTGLGFETLGFVPWAYSPRLFRPSPSGSAVGAASALEEPPTKLAACHAANGELPAPVKLTSSKVRARPSSAQRRNVNSPLLVKLAVVIRALLLSKVTGPGALATVHSLKKSN